MADYAHVCGFRVGGELPITYPHMLAFPLQMRLMTDREFPLPAPGMVHLRNVITQQRPLAVGELGDVRGQERHLVLEQGDPDLGPRHGVPGERPHRLAGLAGDDGAAHPVDHRGELAREGERGAAALEAVASDVVRHLNLLLLLRRRQRPMPLRTPPALPC